MPYGVSVEPGKLLTEMHKALLSEKRLVMCHVRANSILKRLPRFQNSTHLWKITVTGNNTDTCVRRPHLEKSCLPVETS